MTATEWPLIVFTLLTQTAVGAFIVLFLMRFFLQKDSADVIKLTKPGLLAVAPIMAVALLLSLFHLGSPLIAYWSIAHLSTSWLSREILFSGLFFFLSAICFYLYLKDKRADVLGWLTGIAGLLAILSMSSIYRFTIMPAWESYNTYLAFYGTTFVLGPVGAVASIVFSAKKYNLAYLNEKFLRKVSLITAAAILVQLVFLPEYLTGLVTEGQAGVTSAALFAGTYAFPMILRWILTVVGGVMLVVCAYKTTGKKVIKTNSYYFTLLVILMGEIVGRYIFYAITIPTKIG